MTPAARSIIGETVAIIPARGGSRGVPRKNVRRVGGVPLIVRAIESARGAQLVDRVVVSTDDLEIAALARDAGAEIIDRPEALAGDTAGSEAALLHALDHLADRGVRPGVVIFLQATSPFIASADLDAAAALLIDDRYDSVFSAVESWGFLWRADETGTGVTGLNHDWAVRPRRQDRTPDYLETGAFYAFRAEGFRRVGHRFFGRIGVVPVAETGAIEIDTAQQLAIASALAPLAAAPNPIPAGAVSAVVTDFDGVHTDDRVLMSESGQESVTVSRSDGMGIARLRAAGIPVLILSTETNPVVTARARKLDVPVIQAVTDKATALVGWALDHDVPLENIAYLGNDVNDLECLELVGWPVVVPTAHPQVLTAARIVLTHAGGAGAVRELADRILSPSDSPTQTSPAEPHDHERGTR